MPLDYGWTTPASVVEIQQQIAAEKARRPVAVSVVAVLQGVRCWVLIMFLMALYAVPESGIASQPVVLDTISIASGIRMPADEHLLGILAPLFALLTGVTAVGIWFRSTLIRRLCMALYGAAAYRVVRGLIMGSIVATASHRTAPLDQVACVVLLMDIVIAGYLVIHEESFSKPPEPAKFYDRPDASGTVISS